MLYALLLAGGKSSRMGQDKALLEYQGKTLLEHSLGILKETGADQLWVSGRPDRNDSLPDLIPDCGPLGGLHAAFNKIHSKGQSGSAHLLVIPVDMPMLTPDSLKSLIQSIGKSDSCHYANEIFPCVFGVSLQLRDYLNTLLSEDTSLGGQRSMKSLLKKFSHRVVPPDAVPEHTFLNINHPEDWKYFLTLAR